MFWVLSGWIGKPPLMFDDSSLKPRYSVGALRVKISYWRCPLSESGSALLWWLGKVRGNCCCLPPIFQDAILLSKWNWKFSIGLRNMLWILVGILWNGARVHLMLLRKCFQVPTLWGRRLAPLFWISGGDWKLQIGSCCGMLGNVPPLLMKLRLFLCLTVSVLFFDELLVRDLPPWSTSTCSPYRKTSSYSLQWTWIWPCCYVGSRKTRGGSSRF